MSDSNRGAWSGANGPRYLLEWVDSYHGTKRTNALFVSSMVPHQPDLNNYLQIMQKFVPPLESNPLIPLASQSSTSQPSRSYTYK